MPMSSPNPVLPDTMVAAAEPSGRRRTNYLRDLLLCTPLLIFIQFLAWVAFLPGALRGHADFRQLYAAGYLVRTGHSHQLYDYGLQRQIQDLLVSNDERALPFIRPAYQALLFVPFSLLPYRTAYLAFLIVNFGLLTLCFILLRDNLANLRNEWWGLPAALVLAFYPIELAIMQGQDSILLLACLCAALIYLRRGLDLTAGLLLGLGLFKLQIVIPIVLLFLLWRRWKFSAGFAMSAGTLSTISIIITGWPQTLIFIRSLLSVGTGMNPADAIKFPLRITLMANLRGLVAGIFTGQVPASWIQVATAAVSILALIWVVYGISHHARADELFSIAIVTSVFVSYYLFIHDMAVLIIPILLTLNRFIRRQTCDVDSPIAKSAAGLMFLAPMLVFLMPGHFYLVALLIGGFLSTLVQMSQPEIVSVNAAAGVPAGNYDIC
jgi:hypothetical protein